MKKYNKIYESTLIMKLDQKFLLDELFLAKHIKVAAIKGNMTIKNLNIDYLHANYKGKLLQSYSLTLVVEESHISIYTYPEYNRLHINIATCSNKRSIQEIIKYFKKIFKIKKENKIRIISVS